MSKEYYQKNKKRLLEQKKEKNFLYSCKLTQEIANEIRRQFKTGEYSQRKLGKIYNVHFGTIWQIVNYKTWKEEITDEQ